MPVEHAYAPGLRVTSLATIRKERRLPIAGQVLAKEGARVRAEDIVAQAELPGDVATVNVVNQLGITPAELPNLMLKKIGEPVKKDEIIAQTKPFLKFLRSSSRSPIDGTIETVSHVTGQVMIRTAPKLVHVRAYVDGTVVEVWPGEGVAVQTTGAFIQGILGVGGEVAGEIAIAGKGPDDMIGPNDLGDNLAGKIVVAGRLITREVFDRAGKVGIAAIVCGGFHDADLRGLLGYDLGVAITGHEDIHPTLIITEGFGEIAMARGTYELLASHAGHRASENGATQIRAGVLRPEIIIPKGDGHAVTGGTGVPPVSSSAHPAHVQAEETHGQDAHATTAPDESHKPMGLTVGCLVRIIREPGFGRLGTVKSLPPEAQRVESEAKVRVVELEFPKGETMLVPRTNVEVIGS